MPCGAQPSLCSWSSHHRASDHPSHAGPCSPGEPAFLLPEGPLADILLIFPDLPLILKRSGSSVLRSVYVCSLASTWQTPSTPFASGRAHHWHW